MTSLPCNGCGRSIDGSGCRPCAILICWRCRKDIDIFRRVRSNMFRHIDDHLVEGRKLHKHYPFNTPEEATRYA